MRIADMHQEFMVPFGQVRYLYREWGERIVVCRDMGAIQVYSCGMAYALEHEQGGARPRARERTPCDRLSTICAPRLELLPHAGNIEHLTASTPPVLHIDSGSCFRKVQFPRAVQALGLSNFVLIEHAHTIPTPHMIANSWAVLHSAAGAGCCKIQEGEGARKEALGGLGRRA